MHGSSSSRIATLGHLRVWPPLGTRCSPTTRAVTATATARRRVWVAWRRRRRRRVLPSSPSAASLASTPIGSWRLASRWARRRHCAQVADGIQLRARIAVGAGASTIGDTRLVADWGRGRFIAPTWGAMRATTYSRRSYRARCGASSRGSTLPVLTGSSMRPTRTCLTAPSNSGSGTTRPCGTSPMRRTRPGSPPTGRVQGSDPGLSGRRTSGADGVPATG